MRLRIVPLIRKMKIVSKCVIRQLTKDSLRLKHIITFFGQDSIKQPPTCKASFRSEFPTINFLGFQATALRRPAIGRWSIKENNKS